MMNIYNSINSLELAKFYIERLNMPRLFKKALLILFQLKLVKLSFAEIKNTYSCIYNMEMLRIQYLNLPFRWASSYIRLV